MPKKILIYVIVLIIIAAGVLTWHFWPTASAPTPSDPNGEENEVDSEKIRMITDKLEYKTGETVHFTISSLEKIHFLRMGFALDIEKYQNNKWTEQHFNTWHRVACNGIMLEPPACVLPEKEIGNSWDQILGECVEKEWTSFQALPGKYRLKFNYWDDECWGWRSKKVYSNEFIILEE